MNILWSSFTLCPGGGANVLFVLNNNLHLIALKFYIISSSSLTLALTLKIFCQHLCKGNDGDRTSSVPKYVLRCSG